MDVDDESWRVADEEQENDHEENDGLKQIQSTFYDRPFRYSAFAKKIQNTNRRHIRKAARKIFGEIETFSQIHQLAYSQPLCAKMLWHSASILPTILCLTLPVLSTEVTPIF